MKRAIVIIPTYNERENIPQVIPLLLSVFKQVKGWEMGILVVDDTSPDKTYEVVEELTKKHKQVYLLINKKKSGLGGAYLKGMEYAFDKLKADVVFEFDADLSHDATKIPLMLDKIDQGYDMVLGSRYIKGGGIPPEWGLHRKFLSVVGNIVIMLVLTDFRVHDWTAGFRALTKKVFAAVAPELTSNRFSGYTFQVGFLHKTVRKGFKVAEVPYKFVDRTYGQSKIGPEYLVNTLMYILKARIVEILHNRIFKFAMVGGIGALVQLITLQLWRQILPFQFAFFMAIESAIVSNFILNNLWTFSDRKLALPQVPVKFAQFNLASGGSILIQQAVALVGEFGIGLFNLFTLPIIMLTIDTGQIYAVVGILIGMFWNFFAYNRFIWRAKAKPATL